MLNIIPRVEDAAPPMNVAPLAFALERMPAELLAPALPGEDLVGLRTRRAACADILDELLREYDELAGAAVAS